MKVIIPLAGKGTRLRPHTYVTPKPMMKVAGKPVMSYILDDLKKLGNIDQIIYITGHLKEKIEEFARSSIDVPSVHAELSGGHAVFASCLLCLHARVAGVHRRPVARQSPRNEMNVSRPQSVNHG